jgi:VCBS repeat-containing protein
MIPLLHKAMVFSNENIRFRLLSIIFMGILGLAFANPAASAVVEVLGVEQAIVKNASVNPKGYVELNASNSRRSGLEWAFNAPSAGDYEIRFHYHINKHEFSPLMSISTSTYVIAKKRFFDTLGTWQEETWLIKAGANEQVIIRLEVDKPSLDKNRVERIYIDKLTIGQPSFLNANVKVVADQEPEFGQSGYENTYYGIVDPQGQRTTLKKWLRTNGYTIKRNKQKIVRSQYINSFDLGFGRSMSCLDVGHLSCYVDNYINLDRDKPVTVQTKLPAFAATVTMERMQFLDPVTQQSRLITAFFVYDKDGRRINRAPLDNEGAKAVPESCYACHKGNIDSNGNPVGGQFLPWDLHLLDQQLRGSPAIAKQIDAIRELNHMVWKDAAVQYDPNDPTKVRKQSLKNLIEGWYGGEPLPGTTYNPNFIPSTWYTDPASANIECSGVPTSKPCKEKFSYQSVYANYCRTCHVTHGEGQDVGNQLGFFWKNADEFRSDANRVICISPNAAKLMPNAELTYHRFNTDIVPGTGRTAKDILCNAVKDNHKPTANPDVGPNVSIPDTNVNVSVNSVVSVMQNDTKGDGQNTVALASSTPPHGTFGTLTLNPDGSYNYILDKPDDNLAVKNIRDVTKQDTAIYSYVLTDEDGDTSTATLTIPIFAGSQAGNVSRTIAYNDTGLLNGNVKDPPTTFPNITIKAGSTVALSPPTPNPATGTYGSTLSLSPDGTYSYDLNEANATVQSLIASNELTENFSYKLTDTNNVVSTATITITITGKQPLDADIQPIIDASCVSCHAPPPLGIGQAPDFSGGAFTSSKPRIKVRAGTEGTMPPPPPTGAGPLSQELRNIINAW